MFLNKCSYCDSKEHSSSDCPHGIFSNECSSCGSKNHSSSDCPHGIFSSECSSCGSKDHSSSDCPHGIFSTECSNCGGKNHSSNDCPHNIFSTECSNCGSKEHSSSDCPNGGCFITSATLLSTGKSDDCYELNSFRSFRDNWLIKQKDGKKLIKTYYEIAPLIVNNINSHKKNKDIFINIWKNYLSNCLIAIEKNQFQEAKAIYLKLVDELKNRYLPEE